MYVCEGSYPEAVRLDRAVSAHGGFACGTWRYASKATRIAPRDVATALTIVGVPDAHGRRGGGITVGGGGGTQMGAGAGGAPLRGGLAPYDGAGGVAATSCNAGEPNGDGNHGAYAPDAPHASPITTLGGGGGGGVAAAILHAGGKPAFVRTSFMHGKAGLRGQGWVPSNAGVDGAAGDLVEAPR